MKITQTNRGFDRIDFEDYNGKKCHLQKSSLATDDCIWLGHSAMEIIHLVPGNGWQALEVPNNTQCNTVMHLTREQVKELLPYLKRFIKTGNIAK